MPEVRPELDELRGPLPPARQPLGRQLDIDLLERIEELETFRDAGLLTEVELVEQKAKLRWGIP